MFYLHYKLIPASFDENRYELYDFVTRFCHLVLLLGFVIRFCYSVLLFGLIVQYVLMYFFSG